MAEKSECPMCKGDMEVIETKIVADTPYAIIKCKKCNHQVAKRQS